MQNSTQIEDVPYMEAYTLPDDTVMFEWSMSGVTFAINVRSSNRIEIIKRDQDKIPEFKVVEM